MNKVTNFTYQPAVEGERIIITYAEINDNGDIISTNNKKNVLIVDEKALQCLEELKNYLVEKI